MIAWKFWRRKEPEMPLDIKEMHFKDGAFEVTTENADMVRYFQEIIAAFWEANGSPVNYCGLKAWVPELGMMELSVRKLHGEAPADKAARLERENLQLRARIKELEAQLPGP